MTETVTVYWLLVWAFCASADCSSWTARIEPYTTEQECSTEARRKLKRLNVRAAECIEIDLLGDTPERTAK